MAKELMINEERDTNNHVYYQAEGNMLLLGLHSNSC